MISTLENPKVILTVVLITLSHAACNHQDTSRISEEIEVRRHFSSFGSTDVDWDALIDLKNNGILNTCITGATQENLEDLGITDLTERLEILERAKLIKKMGTQYNLTFPVIKGNKRAELQELVEHKSSLMLSHTEKMVQEIKDILGERKDMTYHAVWSIVMDGPIAWNSAQVTLKNQVKTGNTSINDIAWLIYPSHSHRVGTNTYNLTNSQVRITWSLNTPMPHEVHKLIKKYEEAFTKFVVGHQPLANKDAHKALTEYGIVDAQGQNRLYIIDSSSEVAQVYSKLGDQFGRLVVSHLDVEELAHVLEVTPGEALVITYHEICYELLKQLAANNVLEVPRIVQRPQMAKSDEYLLISVVAYNEGEPFLQSMVSDEEKKIMNYFRKIKAKILAGEAFQDLSTPVNTFLSLISVYHSQNNIIFQQVNAMDVKTNFQFSPDDVDYYRDILIYRVPKWSENPKIGEAHPIYVMSSEETNYSDVELFIYQQDGWKKLGNIGRAGIDWRKCVDILKKAL